MNAIMRKQILAAAVLLIGGPLGLRAQAQQEVPTLEPTYTRIFGSDTLTIDPVTNIDPKVALSPNEKWIVFTSTVGMADEMSLWVAPVEGGEPARLLERGDYSDHQPVWFPNSDRIAFRSNRPSTDELRGAFVMTVPIAPEIGQRVAPERRVTLERILQYGFSVSPDGRSIAYVGGWNVDRALRIIPATGGTARTVAEHRRIFAPVWSPDGEHLYYIVRRTDTGPFEITRVAVVGGTPEVLSSVPPSAVFISPDVRHLCRHVSGTDRQPRVYEISTVEGQVRARFELPKTMTVTGYTPDGQALLAVMDHTVAPLRVLSLNGGPSRQLTESHAYDVTLGWTSDGEKIFFSTELNGSDVFMLAPRDGGAMQQVPLPGRMFGRHNPVLSSDGAFVLHTAADEATGAAVLKIVDLSSGEAREISSSLWDRYPTFNPVRAGDNFLYGEQHADRFEFRSVRPDGRSVLLRSFPADEFPPLIGVHGERVAFTRESGDSTSLYIAMAGQVEARRVLTVEGMLSARGSAGPAWSPDGRQMALAYSRPTTRDNDIMLVEVTSSGEMVGAPRILNLEPGPAWWWDVEWLPDASAFVITGFGGDHSPPGTNVWLVSLETGSKPVMLTGDDPGNIWSSSLSPDGRYLAYSGEELNGSSVWRVELGDVLEPARP
ncbi:TolB family protein [Gemmatimonadota bacterium]